jgi:Cu/Ag efflux protein CusF
MSNRVKGWMTAAVIATFVALPLAASAGQAAPPANPPAAAQAQASSASGELVKVDAAGKSITIKA